MHFWKKIINYFKIFIPFLFLQCTVNNYHLEKRFQEATQLNYYQYRYVHIDPSFTLEQQQVIKESLRIWSDKSYNYVRWDIEPWSEDFWNGDLRSSEEKQTRICRNHLIIFNTVSTDPIVEDLEFRVGHTITGWAEPTNNICGIDYFILVTDRIHSLLELKQVTLHESGHILGLIHNEKGEINSNEKSIMSYRWMRTLQEPTDYDLHWLLSNIGF